MAHVDEVLVPLVNAPHQRAAITRAFTAFPDAHVSVLNVLTPIDAPLSEGGVLTVSDERVDRAHDRARRLVREATGASPSEAPGVDIVTTQGWPAPAAAQYIATSTVDRIVVGGRDRSTVSELLLGKGTASAIDEKTRVPVTVLT